jgi:hypothetical protein
MRPAGLLLDQRVQQGLQRATQLGVAEHPLAQPRAVQARAVFHQIGAELRGDRRQRCAARPGQLARDGVGVDEPCSQALQDARGRALARRHAAGQAEPHCGSSVGSISASSSWPKNSAARPPPAR